MVGDNTYIKVVRNIQVVLLMMKYMDMVGISFYLERNIKVIGVVV